MSFFGKPIRAAAVAAGLVLASPALAPSAFAQEVSAEHLSLAVQVVQSAGATRGFNVVLPDLASQVIDRLIRLRPDLHKEIAAAAEAAALKLAVRRSELDTEVARVWAGYFTPEELESLLAFYKSPAGEKFSQVGPRVVQESFQAVERWSGRVGDELLEQTRLELRNQGIEIGN